MDWIGLRWTRRVVVGFRRESRRMELECVFEICEKRLAEDKSLRSLGGDVIST